MKGNKTVTAKLSEPRLLTLKRFKQFFLVCLITWLLALVARKSYLHSYLRQKTSNEGNQLHEKLKITSYLPPSSLPVVEWPRETLKPVSSPLNIFLFWTTSRKSFRNRNYQVIDAYLYHHPLAKLHIIASNLTDSDFAQYTRLGHQIKLHQLTDQYLFQLSEGCPMAKSWINRIDEWKLGPYYYSHITDFMRFCVLYQYGGMYSDFDAIALQPIEYKSFIGKDSSNTNGLCMWCLVGGENYLAPGVMAVANKHHPLLAEVLTSGFNPARYNPKDFGSVGPGAITKAYNALSRPDINVLDNHILYPFTFVHADKLMRNQNDSWNLVDRLKRTSLSLHFFGHTTRRMAVEPESILAAAFNHTSVILRQPASQLSGSRHCGLIIKAPEYISVGKGYGQIHDLRAIVTSDFPLDCDLPDMHVEVRLKSLHGQLLNPLFQKGNGTQYLVVAGGEEKFSIAALNHRLSRVYYRLPYQVERDVITAEIYVKRSSGSPLVLASSRSISIYNPSKLVTILIKTFGRMEKVFSLVHSIRQRYPHISILASDDGENAHRIKSGKLRSFDYLALPYDVGLSAGRNRMLELVRTEFFLTLDDDFTFDENSVIEGLLHAMERGGFDIAAGKNPQDEKRFKLDFCGIFRIASGTLYLEPGIYGTKAGCHHVDFVPNLFVARTTLREKIQWDEQLKLGEHEDFFLRAKSIGLKVATCPSVSFHHDQAQHWLRKTAYDRMRNRVYDYWRISLRKHKLLKLRSFGNLMMDLVPPKRLKCIRATDVLPYSLTINYEGCTNERAFMVAKSLNGSFYETVNGGEGNLYRKKRISVMGLQPNTLYWFLVYSGNNFDFEKDGRIIVVSTNTLKDVEIPLQNWGFENGHFHWKGGVGSNFHIIETANHTSSFVGRLSIDKSGYLSSTPTVSVFYQDVTLPPDSNTNISAIFISGLSKSERLFGTYVDWRIGAWVYFEDGAHFERHEKFDKASGDWQIRTLHLCINPLLRIKMVRVYGMLQAYRGAVVFDDIFMVPRRGSVPLQSPVY